jgi:two-component system sensor histidine kinase KdpD
MGSQSGQWRGYLYAVIGVCVVTVLQLPFYSVLHHANSPLIYFLLVLVIGAANGTGPALFATGLAYLCINFFFVEPRFTLGVADEGALLDLTIFVIVAGIAGRLAANTRYERLRAQQRAYEQSILYKLTRRLNRLSTAAEIYATFTQLIREDLGATAAEILTGCAFPPPSSLNPHFPIQSGDQTYGTLSVTFPAPPDAPRLDLLNTCIAQVGMALQRVELAERARRSDQFEQADRLKTTLLHAISHDLRTPITIIKTSANNLRRLGATLSAAEQAEITATIEGEADQLDQLVGNLLDMSRLQAGALRLNAELNALEEVAGDVAARQWQLHKRERVRLHFPDDLPLVQFDYGLILQALTNLVENSLRYEPPQSVVAICGEVGETGAVLKVINHGANISAEVKQHMMEPFYRGPEGRYGLGLPIAEGIVRAHGGTLQVEDTPGGGATFVIRLPLTIAGGKDHETQNTRG